MSDSESKNPRKRPAEFEALFEEEGDVKGGLESEDDVDEDGNVAGDLDLSKADTQAWLVKVLEAWSSWQSWLEITLSY